MSTITSSIGGLHEIPLVAPQNGAQQFSFRAEPGLYQLSVIADARDFNWDELYIDLHEFGNNGRRTGPWDFDLTNGNKPLVPTYRVSIDGRYIGLWIFQRVSLEDIENRRFRGRMAFQVRAEGEVRVTLQPYRPMSITWMTARLETDPEDALQPELVRAIAPGRLEAMEWAEPEFWATQRDRLATTHAVFREPLRNTLRHVLDQAKPAVGDIPFIVAYARLEDDTAALARALNILDAAIALPHWGNPDPEGYSHDGDMAAARHLSVLAWSYHALRPELGAEREGKLLEKLRLQGERFMELALLNRDYWGGSIMQDHGRVSMAAFGTAVLHLLGVVPEANDWLAYALPRVQRSIDAMPRDGVVPQSSYGKLSLYLDEMTPYRDALLALSGRDIFDDAPFQLIVDYVSQVLNVDNQYMVVATYNMGAQVPLDSGMAFFNRMATRHGDGRAAYLVRLLLHAIESVLPAVCEKRRRSVLPGFLTFDPSVEPVAQLPEPKPLRFFVDSGLVHYRDRASKITLATRCGPWLGYHADRFAKGPCDRIGGPPGAGHFVVVKDGEPILTTPDAGYSLHSGLCSCLLIDDRGQYGDIGYPMSIPSKIHRGEEIEVARWDAAAGAGYIRFNLQPAYPEALGLVAYTRELILRPGQSIVCRDRVVLEEPRRLSWLFQGQAGTVMAEAKRCRFGTGAYLWLEPLALNLELLASVRPTDIAWSYSSPSGYQNCEHARYDTALPVASAAVDFVFTWQS